jgi:nicotinate-nucleotide adenylyltransferase
VTAWGLNLAIFGGTFDPIHRAHLEVARAARDAFRLDRVLIVPAAVPPHKRGRQTESWEHRFRMVELACVGEPAFEPSSLESGTEQSYSILTIERVRPGLAPDDRLFFIIGADAFAEITTWYRWQDVLEQVEFIVVTRPGHEYPIPEGARLHPLASVQLPVSSSAIREKLVRCEAPPELTPPVFDYIQEHRLYGFGSACAPGE